MNFTGEIKRDLIKFRLKTRSCRVALLKGVFDTCGGATYFEDGAHATLFFTSENEQVAAHLLDVFEQTFDAPMTVTEAVRDPKQGRHKFTFTCTDVRTENFIKELLSHAEGGDEDVAYLCGAFLGSGSCTLPHAGKKTGYHLEIVFESGEDAEKFIAFLDRLQIIANVIVRGEKSVVYLKSREAISDFLSVTHAQTALTTLEAVSAVREENNNENRIENCIAGNADRAAIASAAQTVALEALKGEGVFFKLPEPLRTVAEARLMHPELSLTELAEELGLSKSCLNHRLRKLMKIYTDSHSA